MDVIRDDPHKIFVTVSGSHLYGFPSADSDIDYRGVHVAPRNAVLGLNDYKETIEVMGEGENPADTVTHEARKFFRLLLANSGYAQEQIFSPLVVVTSDFHDQLKEIAPRCVTKHHTKHYIGFTNSQVSILRRRPDKKVKVILYMFRTVLTGLNFVRSGQVLSHLPMLNEEFKLPYIPKLIEEKLAGLEHDKIIGGHDLEFYMREQDRLMNQLKDEYANSNLPDDNEEARHDLNDLLIRIRESYP